MRGIVCMKQKVSNLIPKGEGNNIALNSLQQRVAKMTRSTSPEFLFGQIEVEK